MFVKTDPMNVAQARARCAARSEAAQPEAEGHAGWHDSSFALSRGLSVIEHADDDPAALELAVALWLQ